MDSGIPAPEASFQASADTATVKDVISFTNTSKLAESFEWDFGDGSFSQDFHATHQFKEPGTFQVALTATGPGGTDKVAKAITIEGLVPVAKFSVSADGLAAPATVQFANESEHATEFEWDFGDGATSALEHPEHTYEVPGRYTVTLNAKGEFGSASASEELTVKGSITPGFSVDGVQLGDTFGSIKSRYVGFAYRHVWVAGNPYIHLIIYENLGLIFGFANYSPVLSNEEATIGIFAEEPYKGYTDSGIRIGSPESEVVEIYGPWEEKDPVYGDYEYPSKGIDFSFDGQPEVVSRMFIYEPNGFGAELSKEQFQKAVLEYL